VTSSVGSIDALANLTSKGRTGMASSGKKKTTMAKMDRENRVRERRAEKKAKKDARKLVGVDQPTNGDPLGIDPSTGEPLTGDQLPGDAVDPA
jgi:hypothetical protein